VDLPVKRFAATTRTAEDAAHQIGTLDERRLATALGAPSVRRATADEAKTFTGYAIGGVPPFAHLQPCRVIADEGLLAFEEVWAAAGLPDAVFPIAPSELVRIAEAEVAPVASPPGAPAPGPRTGSA
jgi:prolyl-tRNA editing enzyme YbaK/EbsC (Cys-tRNA(Pro) deacylase)